MVHFLHPSEVPVLVQCYQLVEGHKSGGGGGGRGRNVFFINTLRYISYQIIRYGKESPDSTINIHTTGSSTGFKGSYQQLQI